MTTERPTTYNILFVCTGNTCRSPLAEAIARNRLEERGWDHVRVASAGTGASWDAPASQGSLQAASDIGLDLSDHRSQPLTKKLVDEADVILAMTPAHLAAIEAVGGEGKASLLTRFLHEDEAGQPIPDPIGGPPELYAQVRAQIEQSVAGLLDRLEAILSP